MTSASAAEKVYTLVAKIPTGKVTTYGDLARATGLKTPRQVGWILHRNPDHNQIPCHRVVFSDGQLSGQFAFGGCDAQANWLRSEGVPFVGNKVEMKTARFSF